MKKLLLPMIGVLTALPVLARDFTYEYQGQTLTYTVLDETNKTCQTKAGYYTQGQYFYEYYAGNEVSGDLIIPETASDGTADFTVTEIGQYGFYHNGLTSVTLPNSLQTIGDYAFWDCRDLASMTFGESPISIGSSSFKGCGFTSFIFPNSVQAIGFDSFGGCHKLTSITFNNTLKEIPDYAFSYCTALKDVVVPSNVETIGNYAFAGNTALTSIAIGTGMKSIGKSAFYECPLSTIYITAVTPPAIEDNTFPNDILTKATFYVQSKNYSAYMFSEYKWSQFRRDRMVDATEVTIEGEKVITGKPGDTFQLTANLKPTNASLPYIFWHSTNTAVATVDPKGLVTIVGESAAPKSRADNNDSSESSCKIIAETLYADGPVAEVEIYGVTSSIGSIKDEMVSSAEIDFTSPYEIYNLTGTFLRSTC